MARMPKISALPPRDVTIIQGPPGCGKTRWAESLEGAVILPEPNMLLEQFNSTWAGKPIVVVDNVTRKWVARNQNTLKNIIRSSHVGITRKFQSTVVIENTTAFVFLTDETGIAEFLGPREICVTEVPDD